MRLKGKLGLVWFAICILVILCGLVVVSNPFITLVFGGELEELKYQNASLKIQIISKDLQTVIQERNVIKNEMIKQGYTFNTDGNFVRPKKSEEKK